MATEKKKSLAPVYVLTGVFLFILCAAVCIAALIVPYEKGKTYLGLAFMDQSKTAPAGGASGLNEGLIIKENPDIDTNPDAQNLSEQGEIIRPVFGEQYAVLRCEAAQIEVPVFWGSTQEMLERGACQSSSSKVLGETGNVVISAHVNTFFANLSKMQPGDEVVLYTEYGVFTYTVREMVKFENTDKQYVSPKKTDQLTLYTCEAQVLGTSTTRVGAVCDLTSRQFRAASGEGAAE
ncbi:MAG: class D sortase [Oscillospiraceae bacterium]|nr:class D sortase [Oscillospiraceae bacterium]